MASVQDVTAYILKNYPHKEELSNARVCKMIYLADWRHAILNRKTITNIHWYFDNFGPYVEDVKATVESNPFLFTTQTTSTLYGDPKKLFALKDHDYIPKLSESEKLSIDHVIENTKILTWSGFIKLIYSTFPIQSSERYRHLDLVKLAKLYEGERERAV